MNIVTVEEAALFRPSHPDFDCMYRINISAVDDKVRLICPDYLANDNPTNYNLDGPAEQDIIHIVVGSNGHPHIEPYWAAPNKSPLEIWEVYSPSGTIVNIGRLKEPIAGLFQNEDIFLPLWDIVACKEPSQMTSTELFWYNVSDSCAFKALKLIRPDWQDLAIKADRDLTEDDRNWLRRIRSPETNWTDDDHLVVFEALEELPF